MTQSDNKTEPFRDWISSSSRKEPSKVVLALDLDGENKNELFRSALKLVDLTVDYCCGIRFGRQSVLNLGITKTRRVISKIHRESIPCIIDDKLADIGNTNVAITRAYYRIGFDGIIVNPLPGWREGIEPVVRLSHEIGKGVIVLVYMSHPGAAETFGQKVFDRRSRRPRLQYEKYARQAVQWGVDGVVVGATRPSIISKVKPLLDGQVPIYSPGVGAQGGDLIRAKKAGSDYFIIGRSITRSKNPSSAARKFARESA